MGTEDILDRLYGVRPSRIRRWRLRVQRAYENLLDWYELHNWRLTIAVVAIAIWSALHVYYYNRLVVLEYDCKMAEAQIAVNQEKRSHIQKNLTKLLRYYANYERALMTDVTELRTDEPGTGKTPKPTDGGDLAGLLGRLSAVAEQYPNLHLTNTVQRFSEAVVSSEAEIASSVRAYNLAVNLYTTVLSQFPGNIFGRAVGFEPYDFYEPKDKAALEYGELNL